MEVDIGAAQQVFVVFFEALIGFAAIETDGMNMRIMGKQGSEVIALFIFYVSVKAALSLADGNGIPKGNMMAAEHSQTLRIVSRWSRLFQDAGHHGPEAILGMGIILLGFQRGHAGHGAENQMGTVFVNAGSKALALKRGYRQGNTSCWFCFYHIMLKQTM